MSARLLGAVWAQPVTRFGVAMQLVSAACAVGFGVYLRATWSSRLATGGEGVRAITLSAYEQGVMVVIFMMMIAGGVSIASGMVRASRGGVR